MDGLTTRNIMPPVHRLLLTKALKPSMMTAVLYRLLSRTWTVVSALTVCVMYCLQFWWTTWERVD